MTITFRCQDTGFQGFALPGVTIQQPKQKPRHQSLSEIDKQHNQEISSERVEIEHPMSDIKRCNIVVHKFCNRMKDYIDEVMETACGRHNFRLTHRQLKVA